MKMKFKLGDIGQSVIWDLITEYYGIPIIQGTLSYLMNKDTIKNVFDERAFIDQANRVLSIFNAPTIQNVGDLDKIPDEFKDIREALKDYYKSLQKIANQPIYKKGLLYQSGVMGTLTPEHKAKNLIKKTTKKQLLRQIAPQLNLPTEFVDVLNEDPNIALLLLAGMMGRSNK